MLNKEEIFEAKILIVDDSKDIVDLLKIYLVKAGYQNVHCVLDSRDVLEKFHEIKPDIMVLDLIMPHLDGFEIMYLLKTQRKEPYFPILVITALKDHKIRIKALEAGAKDFITKPFDRLEVLSRIKNLLEARVLHNKFKQYNSNLEATVAQRTRELRKTRGQIIRRLGKAAEFKDEETGLHILRISKMCAALGKAAGLPQDQCDLLEQASPMHDIGKIGIPDRILQKADRLTPGEWEVMKAHTTLGGELLTGDESELLIAAKTIAVTHHERWDGKGYPNGMSGEDIPLFGRICSICDVFDALLSQRPYKSPWPWDMAVQEIKKGRGTQFDPDLVEHFIKILPHMLEIVAQYQKEMAAS